MGKRNKTPTELCFPNNQNFIYALTYHIVYVQSKFQDNDKNEMIFLKNTFFMII